MRKKSLHNKCKKIKLVITDVDGVLTDGGRYYSEKGEELKKFHVRDGMGVNILLRNGIKTVLLSKEKSKIVKKWAKDMNVSSTFFGVLKKELKLKSICKKFNTNEDEVAFIGDDINDLMIMKLVGLSATPKDGIFQAKKAANYVCFSNGGEGAFREFADLILSKKFSNKKDWY